MYWAVEPRFNLGFWPVAVTGWFVSYLFFWHGELFFAFGDLLNSRQHLEGHKKDQVSYMIAALAIGYFGGITNWPMWFGIHIPPYPNILISVYTLLVAYAMVRHHLMDINIVIRKTLLYSLVSATLAAVYVGTITFLAQLFGTHRGSASVFSSALAAIFITLLFNPIRIRTQRWIDRRFPHEHLDPDLLQEAAGTFAHEMKRPLTKISLPAQLALMELERVKSGEATWKEFTPILEQRLQFIISQSIEAGYVIEAIRELSMTAVPFEAVNIKQALEAALNANKDLLEKHAVAISLQLSADLPAISGRPKQLEIVFANLIKNAAEAMRDLPTDRKRELRIDGRSDHTHIIIDISDSGPGIKPEEMGKLFSARYSTKGQSGTGLGLYLSHEIIEGHNGTVEVSSREGSGTTFTIRLPITSKTH
jgi:signal transduction histidine kinase